MPETETVKPEKGERSSRSFSGLLVWTFGALVIYILCLGPAFRVILDYPSTTTAIVEFYRPFLRLIGTCPPLSDAAEWYVELWR